MRSIILTFSIFLLRLNANAQFEFTLVDTNYKTAELPANGYVYLGYDYQITLNDTIDSLELRWRIMSEMNVEDWECTVADYVMYTDEIRARNLTLTESPFQSIIFLHAFNNYGFDSAQVCFFDPLDSVNTIQCLWVYLNVPDTTDTSTSASGIVATGAENLHITPNPAKDFLRIDNLDSQFTVIELIDQQGRVVLSTVVEESPRIELDLHDLETGVYLVSGRTAAGDRFIRKIMITK
ncbi:MAG: T9SS type A sorting domain-containing protein [Flavobacteriales bacterium]